MNKKILLAEDDSNLGSLLKTYLDAKDYEVSLFINGKSALEVFSRGAFNLCILDIMMPEMDGLALARAIREIEPSVPVIFLTAKNQQEDIIEGFRTGADDYITKPFSMEELLYRIEAILRRTGSTADTAKEEECTGIGGYIFNNKRQLLVYKDHTISLTTKESELLELL